MGYNVGGSHEKSAQRKQDGGPRGEQSRRGSLTQSIVTLENNAFKFTNVST